MCFYESSQREMRANDILDIPFSLDSIPRKTLSIYDEFEHHSFLASFTALSAPLLHGLGQNQSSTILFHNDRGILGLSCS